MLCLSALMHEAAKRHQPFFLSGIAHLFSWPCFILCACVCFPFWLWLHLASCFSFYLFSWLCLCLSSVLCFLCHPSRPHTSYLSAYLVFISFFLLSTYAYLLALVSLLPLIHSPLHSFTHRITMIWNLQGDPTITSSCIKGDYKGTSCYLAIFKS